MKMRLAMTLALTSALLTACGGGSNSSGSSGSPPPGSGQTGVMTARFDPTNKIVPFPTNLFFSGTTDLTVNIPVVNPNNFGDPTVAINAQDGFSTVAPWSSLFSAPINAGTLTAGTNVRVFEVTLASFAGGVSGVTRELTPGTDFVAAVVPSDTSGKTMAIVPTKALKERTAYMAVLTSGITDTSGNTAVPDSTYFLAKRTSPLINPTSETGKATCTTNATSTDPLLSIAQACGLEPLRLLTNSQEAAAASRGIPSSSIVLSWVLTTQSITPVLGTVRGTVAASPAATSLIVPTGLTTAAAGLPPIADIYVGFIDLPYYLVAPSVGNPTASLTGFWKGPPCGTACSSLGLDPTSTNLTVLNRMPVVNSTVRVPVLMTVPNAASGHLKPGAGWPIVMFQHGITRNRTDMLAISATMAAQGFAVVSIDMPLHGLTPSDSPALQPFRMQPGNALYDGFGVRERTFDMDLSNNTTGAPGPDGITDTSGTYMINLSSLLTSRDNLRQAIADLFVVRKAVPSMNIDGNTGTVDFDTSNTVFAAQSLGSIVGTGFIAYESGITRALLSVPGGGIARLLDGSPTFGPRIRAGLAAAGIVSPSPTYDQFMGAAQTLVDTADPINLAPLSAGKGILLHEVIGDTVVPNAVAGAPLSGTEPLIKAYPLGILVGGTNTGAPVRGAVRFVAPATHGSLLDPTSYAAATTEMQTEMAAFFATNGGVVPVTTNAAIVKQTP